MKQKLDKIEKLIAELKQEIEGTNEHFLTFEEAKAKADWVYKYNEKVFQYKKDGKYTLIEKGKVLISGAEWCNWVAKGVFDYKKDGKYGSKFD